MMAWVHRKIAATIALLAFTFSAVPTLAQFGGTQDMMLERQRRQQEQVTAAGNRPGSSYVPRYPSAPTTPPRPPHGGSGNGGWNGGGWHGGGWNGGGWHGGGYGGGWYDGYPYAYGYPYGYSRPWGPIIYPPGITVVPHGVPLNGDILGGRYSTPLDYYVDPYDPYGYGAVPPSGVLPPLAVAPHVGAIPNAPPANAAAPMQAPAPNAVPPQPPQGFEDDIPRRVAALKPSNEAGRMRADTLIADGDREFAAQQYRRAVGKYRDAIAKAPDYPPGHLRAGFAYAALGDYELAVTYFGMGFHLSKSTNQPGFSLADLYRGNALAQEQHQEAIADTMLRQPQDGGLVFIAGLVQHYSGRPLQARDLFKRASEIPGRHQPYAVMFLPDPQEMNEGKNEAQNKAKDQLLP